MKTTVEYKTVYADALLLFDKKVNEALQEGWQLQFAPLIFADTVNAHYFYAMPMTRVLKVSK